MANQRNVKTWPDELLETVRVALVEQVPFANEYVFIAPEEEQGQPPACDQYATVVLGPQRPEESIITGAGNICFAFQGEVKIAVWVRLGVDQENRVDTLLRDQTLGALPLFRRVVKALQLYDPKNTDLNYLLAEPMRLVSFMHRPNRQQPDWVGIVGTWEWRWLGSLEN